MKSDSHAARDYDANRELEAQPRPVQLDFGPRLAAQWRAKLFGIPACFAAFFAAYFVFLRFPLFPVTEMPVTALDRLIPFSGAAILPYASLWIYVQIPPALMDTRRDLAAHARAAILISVAAMAVFLFWPTSVPPAEVDLSLHPSFAFLRTVDRSGNACPSLHAAYAVFSAVALERLLRAMHAPRPLRLANGLWCALILYSTLATKQHVAVDLYTGAALGAASAAWRPRSNS